MNRTRLACLVSLLVALAAPSAAGAGTVGHGFGPGVAVDAAGTAYIAWSGSGNPASLRFCRLPRGATACEVPHAIVAPGNTTSRAFVVVSGNRVVVMQYRYGATAVTGLYEFVSTNRGTSFKPGILVGSLPFYEAVPGPSDTMSGATDANSGGMLFQNVAIDGSGTATTPSVKLAGVDHPYRGTAGLVDAATPLVVFTSGSDAAQYRRYDGSGSLNDGANWTAPVGLGVASYPKLAGGPRALPAGECGEQVGLRPQVERDGVRAAVDCRRRYGRQPSEPACLPGCERPAARGLLARRRRRAASGPRRLR